MLEIDLGTLRYSYGRILEKSNLTGNYGCEGDILSVAPLSANTYGIECVFDHNNYEVYLTLEIDISELLWILSADTDYKDFNVISITVNDAKPTPPDCSKKQFIKDLQEDYKWDAQFAAQFYI